MKDYNELREWLSNLEHEQWIAWSKSLTIELREIYIFTEKAEMFKIKDKINSRIQRWEKNWIPYKELSEDIKDFDREWADKILDQLPFKCPMHQCGGLMVTKERRRPKKVFIESEHYDGDEQSPDLVCSNCKAVYQFKRFVGKKRK